MKKRTNKQKLKNKADATFSLYIRLKYSDWKEHVRCYTCGKEDHYKKMQNGHFISRGSNSLRFEEDNCRVQCVGCNVFKNGNYIEYTTRMIKEKGADFVEDLKKRGKEIKRFTEKDLEDIIKYYKQKIDDLNKLS